MAKKRTIINPKGNEEDFETVEESNLVDVADNRIYFYSEVERGSILQLNKNIKELSINLKIRSIALDAPLANIYLHINSFGGSLFDALAAADYIKNSDVPIISVVEGCAASAATIISVVASRRLMRKNSFMLIHQLRTWAAGKYEELKDEIENCDSLMKILKDIYKEHTKIPNKELSKMLQRDIWLESDKCLKYGLVDEII